jgi:RNA polymerase sigma factor (TIGR02999 family)
LIKHARDRARIKRGGDYRRVPLDEAVGILEESAGDLIELDECLTRLAAVDARMARVVELRFFGGLSVSETAETLDISNRTVEKDWQMARLWLAREMDSP